MSNTTLYLLLGAVVLAAATYFFIYKRRMMGQAALTYDTNGFVDATNPTGDVAGTGIKKNTSSLVKKAVDPSGVTKGTVSSSAIQSPVMRGGPPKPFTPQFSVLNIASGPVSMGNLRNLYPGVK